MDANEINYLISNDKCVSKIYGGTIACDMLPETIKSFPTCFIVNTASSKYSGEHWISIFLEAKGTAEIFCSFGTMPAILCLSSYFKKFLKKFAYKRLTYNKTCIQNIFSSYCGLYAIAYLKIKCRHFSLKRFLACFTKDLSINDKTIFESIKRTI